MNIPGPRIAILVTGRPDQTADQVPAYRGALIGLEESGLSSETFHEGTDGTATAEVAETIAADSGILAVVGPMSSGTALVCAPIFDGAGVATVSPSASHPALTQRGFRTFFRLVADDDRQGRALARVGRQYLGAASAAVVYDTDAWGTGLRDVIGREFKSLGGEITAEAGVPRWSTDVSRQVDDVAGTDPDLVIFAVHEPEGKAIASGLRDRGLRARFLGTDAGKSSLFLWTGAGEGPYHTFTGTDIARLPSAAAFRQAYVRRFPESSVYSAEGYDAVMLIAAALHRAAGPDRANVLGEIRALQYSGATGRISFDRNGDRIDASIGLYQVRDGAMTYLGEVDELISEADARPTTPTIAQASPAPGGSPASC